MNSVYDLDKRKRLRYSQIFLFSLHLAALVPVLIHTEIVSAADVTLTWKATRGLVEGYRVFERKHGESYDYDYPAWEGPDTTCTVYDLDETITHYFVARAFNGFGESGHSNEVRSTYPPSVIDDGGGGCLVVTAAYGSPIEPRVKVLREFRDRFLITNSLGRAFVNLYNTCSPPAADLIASHDSLRAMVGWSLLPLVGMSWLTINLGLVPTLAVILLLGTGLTSVAGLRTLHRKIKNFGQYRHKLGRLWPISNF